MKAVLVVWTDAVSQDEWTDIEKAKELELPVQKTLGYLLHEDDTKIIVAASYDQDNDAVASIYAIPVSWLIAIEEIKT